MVFTIHSFYIAFIKSFYEPLSMKQTYINPDKCGMGGPPFLGQGIYSKPQTSQIINNE